MSMPRGSRGPQPHTSRSGPYAIQKPTMNTQTPPQSRYPVQPTPHERPSAAWSPEDDTLLWDARENRKLGWPQTAELFDGKSPNACRKRYERLKLQKAPDEWEGAKFDALADVYVRCREEMWRSIAEQLGDREARWQTLEQQVYSHPLSSFHVFSVIYVSNVSYNYCILHCHSIADMLRMRN